MKKSLTPLAAKLCVLVAIIASSSAAQAQINKCEIDGKILYTDQACPEETSRDLVMKPLISVPAAVTSTREPDNASNYSSSRWYTDHEGYSEALRVSRVRNAPLFIYGYTDWCGYCRIFEKEMLPKPGVDKVLSNYVKVRINPEHSSEDEKLFKRWGGRGYPTFWVQSNSKASLVKGRGPFRKKRLIAENEFIANYSLTKVNEEDGVK